LGSGVNGAFTRYVVAPEHRLHRIPDHLDFVSSALSEPTAVCVHATSEQSHITAGDIILVTGPGTIGLLISQIAKAHGAYVILIGAVDDRNRLELGLSLGVDKTLMAGQDNIDLVIQEITRGKGADVAYECSGNQAAANLCLSNLKKRGLYTQVGVFNQAIQLDFNLLVTKEINAIGSFGSTSTDWERAHILLANGVVRCKPLVTCDLPLTQWEEAFLLLERKEACKAILRPL
jgi:L-iditol 2-dehydrogenase